MKKSYMMAGGGVALVLLLALIGLVLTNTAPNAEGLPTLIPTRIAQDSILQTELPTTENSPTQTPSETLAHTATATVSASETPTSTEEVTSEAAELIITPDILLLNTSGRDTVQTLQAATTQTPAPNSALATQTPEVVVISGGVVSTATPNTGNNAPSTSAPDSVIVPTNAPAVSVVATNTPVLVSGVPVGIGLAEAQQIGVSELRLISFTSPATTLLQEMGGILPSLPANTQIALAELLMICNSNADCTPRGGFTLITSGNQALTPISISNLPAFNSGFGGGQVWGYVAFALPNNQSATTLSLVVGNNSYTFATR